MVADQEGSDFDPASPQVLLLVCKWYGKDVEVAKMMVSLYPNPDSPILVLYVGNVCCP